MKLIIFTIGLCLGFLMGGALMYLDNKKEMALLHCAPIVKASTMEGAKKQIEINQTISGVKG